jgi:septum formation protein
LILASASAGRAAVLKNAGLVFRQQAANVDERALETEAAGRRGPLQPGEIALLLAEAKALDVSAREPDAIVIGADQVMECGGALFQKPADEQAARAQLLALRGRTHSLHSGVCVARGGAVLWRHLGEARLTMRGFSNDFLASYCRLEGEAMLRSVGAYRIEGPGIQLFAKIEGDHFTIIGLPLLPLLAYLRSIGWLAA